MEVGDQHLVAYPCKSLQLGHALSTFVEVLVLCQRSLLYEEDRFLVCASTLTA